MTIIATQTFTVREDLKTLADFKTSMKKLSDIGYRAVQLSACAALWGDAPEMNASDARAILDENQLQCISTHIGLDRFINDIDGIIEEHKTLGCAKTALGMPPKPYIEQGLEGFRKTVEEMTPAIEQLKAAGIQVGYHNHDIEFKRFENGRRPIDFLMEEAPKDLMLELDTYWVAEAGGNPATYLKRCAGRIPVIHFKDKAIYQRNTARQFAPIGEGNLHWDEIIAAAAEGGTSAVCVEIDVCPRDPYDCLKSSLEFLKAQGL